MLYRLTKLHLLWEMFLLQIFLCQKVEKIKKRSKNPLSKLRTVLTCLLTFTLQKTHISNIPDYFSFRHFLVTSYCFQKLGLSSINSTLNLQSNKLIFAIKIYQFAAVQETSTAKSLELSGKLKKSSKGLKKVCIRR